MADGLLILQDLLLAVIVTAASVSDNMIGLELLDRATDTYPNLTKAWADAGFRKKVVEHGATLRVDVEVVTKDPQVKGFSVIKRGGSSNAPSAGSCNTAAWPETTKPSPKPPPP